MPTHAPRKSPRAVWYQVGEKKGVDIAQVSNTFSDLITSQKKGITKTANTESLRESPLWRFQVEEMGQNIADSALLL